MGQTAKGIYRLYYNHHLQMSLEIFGGVARLSVLPIVNSLRKERDVVVIAEKQTSDERHFMPSSKRARIAVFSRGSNRSKMAERG